MLLGLVTHCIVGMFFFRKTTIEYSSSSVMAASNQPGLQARLPLFFDLRSDWPHHCAHNLVSSCVRMHAGLRYQARSLVSGPHEPILARLSR
jgi:hypothetical protein